MISSHVKITELEKPNLKKPTLIQGLPGLGFVGKIAVDFFIEQLKPQKIAEIYSTYLTLSDGEIGIKVNSNGTYALPKYEFYAYQERNPSILFLTGDTQPTPWGQYHVAETVLDYVEGFGCKRLIALGGYSTSRNVKDVYVITSDIMLINEYKNRVKLAKGGRIKGAFGIILGLGKKRGMDCLGLLGATNRVYPDLKSAKNVIQFIADMFDFPVHLKDFEKDITNREVNTKRLQQIQRASMKTEEKKGSFSDYIS